jgi:hypothetical protein
VVVLGAGQAQTLGFDATAQLGRCWQAARGVLRALVYRRRVGEAARGVLKTLVYRRRVGEAARGVLKTLVYRRRVGEAARRIQKAFLRWREPLGGLGHPHGKRAHGGQRDHRSGEVCSTCLVTPSVYVQASS